MSVATEYIIDFSKKKISFRWIDEKKVIIYLYKEDLGWNNPQGLICHERKLKKKQVLLIQNFAGDCSSNCIL